MNSFCSPEIIFPKVGLISLVQVFDTNLVLGEVHEGVVHDVLDALLLDLLCQQASLGGSGEFFCRVEEYEVVL